MVEKTFKGAITVDPYEYEALIKSVTYEVRTTSDAVIVNAYVNGIEVGSMIMEVANLIPSRVAAPEHTKLMARVWTYEDMGNDPSTNIELFDILDTPEVE